MATLAHQRSRYHRTLCSSIFGPRTNSSTGEAVRRTVRGRPRPIFTNADRDNDLSVDLAARMAEKIGGPFTTTASDSAPGTPFERATRGFLVDALGLFSHLEVRQLQVLPGQRISNFEQYAHLDDIEALVKQRPELQVALGGNYDVRPDIVVAVEPFPDSELNRRGEVLGPGVGGLATQRRDNPVTPRRALHASVSCKWTMRSDRAQNTRTEALNLVRNRKGRLPHVVAVTMEPTPGRLASIAHGTGDVDCVYHGALYELLAAAAEGSDEHGGPWERAEAALRLMVDGRRLRDVSDLPLDLLL